MTKKIKTFHDNTDSGANTLCYIAIGSNINPNTNIREALKRIMLLMPIQAISSFYYSEPQGEGTEGHPDFTNGVISLTTDMSASQLKFEILRAIERDLGRKRNKNKNAERTIDLDLILYGDSIIEEADLTIPDPEICQRPYIAIPLAEISPDLTIPGSGENISFAAEKLGKGSLRKALTLTASIEAFIKD